ncbi:chloride channel protein [Thermoflavifilum thermophilum]|uniref:H+/Cl-antiporter ClcA n=1 Tax=Thermoflavifilum thermophilum TaxID=1393122 RepID=A0A1I7N653_9BACT|nr:chloride channel protein [Thermoflavifilum thermophilum]SFV30036.1 H+/Cl-antiporter ClcA [Thermoflavifilum thermophilum]
MSDLHSDTGAQAGQPKSQSIPVATSFEGLKDVQGKLLAAPRSGLSKRVIYLTLQAIFNAVLIGFMAKVMIWLINFFTNLCFYGRISIAPASPTNTVMGWLTVLMPIAGGLLVGLMARYGSPGIRGHGIPEAMERILTGRSKVPPIITFLKPVSAAISIGSGGPFGAEGPIISTGGALGSLAGQIMRITDNERKIMLAAGAAAGMTAIFGSPLSSVLLAVELLLFEFSPRSLIPVTLSCATADVMHFILFEKTPIFAMPAIPESNGLALTVYLLMGLVVGVISAFVSKSVYWVEDWFGKTQIHWMWWPAIGAVVVGVVGYFAPVTMGVGYDNIRLLLSGHVGISMMLTLFLLKYISWFISLGTGTSGGTLAPLFTIGGGLGALLGFLLLHLFPSLPVIMPVCALVGMAAMFAGATRALLTSIVFVVETTGQLHGLLPVLGACTAAYTISFFLMKGTILTEKIERRGIHSPDTYEPDILQQILVKDVIGEAVNVLSAYNTVRDAKEWIKSNEFASRMSCFVVVDPQERLVGIVRRKDIFSHHQAEDTLIADMVQKQICAVSPYDQLSAAVDAMDECQTDVIPVVDPITKEVIGLITYQNIVAAYHKRKEEESLFKRSIWLKRKGIQIVLKGRELLGWERERMKKTSSRTNA